MFVGESGKWIKHVRGTVIFVAQPILSADKTTLSFGNLDYTAETASTLKGLGVEAIATLGKPIIVPILERKLVVHFGQYLEKAKSEASHAAGQLHLTPPLTLQFQLENLTPTELAVYGDRLYMNFDASGHASVTF